MRVIFPTKYYLINLSSHYIICSLHYKFDNDYKLLVTIFNLHSHHNYCNLNLNKYIIIDWGAFRFSSLIFGQSISFSSGKDSNQFQHTLNNHFQYWSMVELHEPVTPTQLQFSNLYSPDYLRLIHDENHL